MLQLVLDEKEWGLEFHRPCCFDHHERDLGREAKASSGK